MAVAKVILNGETLMDVTSDTPSASNMLDGIIATKNDGTKVTGNITNKSSTDLTVSGATVTAPAGYYANAASKAVSTTTHPNPSASITSSTGVVTASHTQTTGYVTGGTTTSTTTLTTQAAQTIYPSTADQTIASYRWLTGTQTIKSVTTSNLTAANIAEGVVVKVGDANNASRITQITGTHSGATSYTATISGTGNTTYCYVTYSGTKYYSNNGTFTFKAGDTLTIYCRGNNASVNGDSVSLSSYSYTYTLPIGDITINLSYSSSTSNSIAIYGLVKPTNTLTISAAGTHNVYKYSAATVAAGSAFPPAVTITKAPTIGVNASGVVTASYTGSSSITPTVTSGYVTAGTAGTISTTGTSTYQLTSKAAATYYPSTADQTVASQRWLVGNQTIKSVVTSNLTAENIAEGVTVTVGDSSNASRITQVTGTHSGGPKYTAKITSTGDSNNVFVRYPSATGTKYYTANDEFEIQAGETIYLYACVSRTDASIYVNGERVAYSSNIDTNYTYTVPNKKNVEISLTYGNPSTIYLTEIADEISITSNGDYDVSEYDWATVNVTGDGFTVDQIAMRSISGSISGNATLINNYAFAHCSSLTTANFPSCTTIGLSAFAYCPIITTVSFPLCTIISAYAFDHCTDLSIISLPSCTIISTSAFNYCTSLKTMSFPLCKTIGYGAFYSCSSLTTANFPSCTTIGSSAFYRCFKLSTVSFPSCTTISDYAFNYCSSLTTVSFPLCTTIGNTAFGYCSRLTTVNFPSCTSINNYAFSRCSSLTTVSFPLCTTISAYAFNYCTALSTVSFPSCTKIGGSAFIYCTSLKTVSFPLCTTISAYAFAYCDNLLSLYLLGSSIANLTNLNAFSSTPISNNTTSTGGVYGSIFVPASLYNSYITATNWATYSARIVSV